MRPMREDNTPAELGANRGIQMSETLRGERMASPATQKQVDYILMLVNREHGTSHSHLSQARHVLGWSSSKCSRGLTKVEASAIIGRSK